MNGVCGRRNGVSKGEGDFFSANSYRGDPQHASQADRPGSCLVRNPVPMENFHEGQPQDPQIKPE